MSERRSHQKKKRRLFRIDEFVHVQTGLEWTRSMAKVDIPRQKTCVSDTSQPSFFPNGRSWCWCHLAMQSIFGATVKREGEWKLGEWEKSWYLRSALRVETHVATTVHLGVAVSLATRERKTAKRLTVDHASRRLLTTARPRPWSTVPYGTRRPWCCAISSGSPCWSCQGAFRLSDTSLEPLLPTLGSKVSSP